MSFLGRFANVSTFAAGNFFAKTIIGLLVPAAIVIFWELAVTLGVLSGIFFPPPSKLLLLTIELALQGPLWTHVGATLSRLLPAFLIGASLGLITGLGLGSSKSARKVLEPSFLAIYSVPKIALLPIFLAIFGVGEEAIIGLVATSVFFYVWIYTMGAAMRTPRNLSVTARVFGASRFQILSQVVLRSALPETMSGLRVGVTVALLVCLTSEYVLGAEGIGYLILGSRGLGQHGLSYVGIALAAFTGLILQFAIKTLDKLINPGVYKDTYQTLGK